MIAIFALWKESRYLVGMKKTLDQKMAKELLEHGKTRVTDFLFPEDGKEIYSRLIAGTARGQGKL